MIEKKYKEPFIDRTVIEINGGCNYTCKMCPQTSENGKHGARGKNWLKKMCLPEFERIVAECAEHGVRVINLEGSGEPTLNNDLDKYVEIVKKYGAKAFLFSNGYKMKDDFMKRVVDAGVDFFRFSIIGYDRPTYFAWMNSINFDRVIQNVHEMKEYVDRSGSDCTVATYHLILDQENIEYEKDQYLKLFQSSNIKTEIWKMHNWAGTYDDADERHGQLRTCGRPFSPDLVIRAGGLDGKTGAMHPCCQVLGNDDAAVLGHVSESSIEDIWFGKLYEKLREQHRTGDYPSFCQGCDFLIDDPEVLVYTNHERENNKMHGTEFTLEDYQFV